MLRTDTVYAYDAVKVYCKRGTGAKASIFTDLQVIPKNPPNFIRLVASAVILS